MKNIVLKAVSAVSILALGVGFAQAQRTPTEQASRGFDVQVEIVTGCTVNFPEGGGNVNFGEYSRITTNLTLTRRVVVNCNAGAGGAGIAAGGVDYTLALSNGNNSTTVAGRRLANAAGQYISYNVYQAANITSNVCGGTYWGSEGNQRFSGRLTATGAGTEASVNGDATHFFTVCIPAITGTQPAVGVYTDVLTATLSY